MNLVPDLFFDLFEQSGFTGQAEPLKLKLQARLADPGQGDFEKWRAALGELPDVIPSRADLNRGRVLIGEENDLRSDFFLREALMKFHPWRKGPFELFGAVIDTEWRSDLKWNRIEPHIHPLEGRAVLDVGCGNGYYLWRMLGAGAKLVLGVDPMWLYFFQFQVMQKYLRNKRAAVLPLGVEDLPSGWGGFDTVFSMGLLYHRRDPLEHLKRLKDLLRPGGQAVLETLVIDGALGEVLVPKERYAKMRNVWNLPSCPTVEDWLAQAGFKKGACADVAVTELKEQRRTEWMKFESLEDFLDPRDSSKTIEGYPAPKRAVFTAEKQ